MKPLNRRKFNTRKTLPAAIEQADALNYEY